MRLPVVQSWYAEKGSGAGGEAGLRFTCTQCGNCCTGGPGYVWLSDEEVRRLAALLKLSESVTRRRHVRTVGGGQSLKEVRQPGGKYDCEFLTDLGDGRRGCSVYAARPLQCRTWPFWPENLETREAWAETGRTCPGLDKGRHYTPEQIATIRDADAWPSQPPTSAPRPQPRPTTPARDPLARIRKLPPRRDPE